MKKLLLFTLLILQASPLCAKKESEGSFRENLLFLAYGSILAYLLFFHYQKDRPPFVPPALPPVCPPQECPASEAEEDSSEAFIHQYAQNCPGCDVPILKKGGCAWVTCTMCKTKFVFTKHPAPSTKK